MIKQKVVAVALAVLLLAACTDADRKKLAQASDDLARGVSTLLALDDSLIKNKLIDKDSAITITSAILDVNRIHGKLNGLAKAYSPGNLQSKQALVAGVGELAKAVSDLNASGALHIKNQQSQTEFAAAMAVVQSAVAVLSGVVGGLK